MVISHETFTNGVCHITFFICIVNGVKINFLVLIDDILYFSLMHRTLLTTYLQICDVRLHKKFPKSVLGLPTVDYPMIFI